MKYSKATNYALHTMVFLVAAAAGKAIGVRELAEMLGVSPTYLSKILTKLAKAGFVESTPGVNGGYRPTRGGHDISFLDIIHAIEGPAALFQCSLEKGPHTGQGCLIQDVMTSAERTMEQYLEARTIGELADKIDPKWMESLTKQSD